jgi:hypothetical protein
MDIGWITENIFPEGYSIKTEIPFFFGNLNNWKIHDEFRNSIVIC